MYHQISRNKRNSIIVITGFLLVWLLAGFVIGEFAGGLSYAITGAIILGVLGVLAALYSYYLGSATVLSAVGAHEADPHQFQQLYNIVQTLAIGDGLPVPKVYIIEDPSPNAFATGRDPAHSVICVTQGLVDQMDREEIQGVIGHEMSHVADYDIRTMMMIAVMVGGIAMLSDFVYRWMFFGGFGGRRSSNNDRDNQSAMLITLAVIILAAVAPLFSQLLAMAVSRQREYLADASSVEFTRNPRALLRALEHIAKIESPLKQGTAGTAHLFIVNPREGLRDDNDGFFANLFSTHPPLSKRIARLQALLGNASAKTIGGAVAADS